MEWVACLRKSIEYIEDNLLENVNAEDVAELLTTVSVNMVQLFMTLGKVSSDIS